MSKITWRGGRDMGHASRRVEQRAQAIEHGAEIILEEVVAKGATQTQDLLEGAVTRTGLARQEVGGLPGRHDTGTMVDRVGHETRKRGSVTIGVFGWWGSFFERYFRDQDLGEGNIPAARALPAAEVRAREELRRRIKSLMKNGSID